MRIFLTGASGFIGGHVARLLRERGDDVVALVRSPERAGELEKLGCTLVAGDLADRKAILAGLDGADAAIHGAAVYKIGIRPRERAGVIAANVHGTERVLDAAIEAGVWRIVYISTVNVLGNTHGEIVDEHHTRDLREGFLSTYDESKHRAHQAALERIGRGAPIVIVSPGAVYGPGDHSEVGNLIEQVVRGRLPLVPFADSGLSLVHVEDVAAGVIAALDLGSVGETYLLTGESVTFRDLVTAAAVHAGRRPPKLPLPAGVVRLGVPVGGLVGPLLGFPPNLRELLRASDGVTYWASSEKARGKLGFTTRELDAGLAETVAALR